MLSPDRLLSEIMKLAAQKGASDIHLKAGLVPVIRKHGQLRPLSSKLPTLSADQIYTMSSYIMDERQQAEFLEHQQLDMGFTVEGVGRFRFNIFSQQGNTRVVIRHIPSTVPSIEDLKLPEVVGRIALYERGLVLVTGATGSGKSSTIAAMLNHINHQKNKHILTIEDPVEFFIQDRKSIISQREIGVDAPNFEMALKAALRQDPDVILIGELRDRETIKTALTAAETGHLVFATLHTVNTTETINRILGTFPADEHNQIRLKLASVMKSVISQRLAKKKDKSGFAPVLEVLIANQRIREMITDSQRTSQIPKAIEEGYHTSQMRSFDQSLMELVAAGIIDRDEALSLSDNPDDFNIKFSGIGTAHSKVKQNENVSRQQNEGWDNLGDIELEAPSDDEDEAI